MILHNANSLSSASLSGQNMNGKLPLSVSLKNEDRESSNVYVFEPSASSS